MIDVTSIGFLGAGLVRPECVLAHKSGLLFASDWTGNGGIAVIRPDGRATRILARDVAAPLRPNGIALEPGGSFLLAHLGAADGGVYRLFPDGRVDPVLLEIDGRAMPPTNFVHLDESGRIWATVSTRRQPRDLGYRPDVADGFVILLDGSRARIVADGLGYTNECVVHPDGERLYVNETFARRLVSYAVARNGSLGERKVVATFGAGTFPDGLTFDAQGDAWITSIVSNRVIRVDARGRQEIVVEDADASHLEQVEAAYLAGTMGRPHLDTRKSRHLANISSLAFGGVDLSTGYLGCLLGDAVAHFRSPVRGHPPAHWACDLGPLAAQRFFEDEEQHGA